MIEAYRIGVTLALTNKVSSILGLIARDFAKTDAKAVALKKTLKDIELMTLKGALYGGVGMFGIGLIGKTIKPANEYVHQLELMNVSGMKHLEIVKATQAAWTATGEVMTTSATENLAAIRELRMVFGNTEHAIEFMPTVQKIQAVLQNLRGGNAKDEAYEVAKALEMKGAVRDPQQFVGQADLMTKAIIASGGKIGASDFLGTFKFGRSATSGWSDEFAYTILPTLMQEMKSRGGMGGAGGPGNALMSAYSAIVGGTISQKALKVWTDLGLLDPSKVEWTGSGTAKGVRPGGIKGSDLFQSNPFQWVQDVLLPAMGSHGYDTEAKQREALQYLFTNRTAGFVMSQFLMQPWKFTRDQALDREAGGLTSYDQLIRADPEMAMQAFEKQWENFKISIGKNLVPIIVPALVYFTDALNGLARWSEGHSGLVRLLTIEFGALAGVMAFSGTVMLLRAAFMALGALFTVGSGVAAGGLIATLGSVTLGIAAFVAAVGALYYLYENKDKLRTEAGKILYDIGHPTTPAGEAPHEKSAFRRWFEDVVVADNRRRHPATQTADDGKSWWESIKDEIHALGDRLDGMSVNLDGRKVGAIVARHHADAAGSPVSSTSRFDPGMSLAPVGLPGPSQ